MKGTETVRCWLCGTQFEMDRDTLAERKAAGLTKDRAECAACTRRWERAWADYMARNFPEPGR